LGPERHFGRLRILLVFGLDLTLHFPHAHDAHSPTWIGKGSRSKPSSYKISASRCACSFSLRPVPVVTSRSTLLGVCPSTTMRSLRYRASRISWVTTSIVVP